MASTKLYRFVFGPDSWISVWVYADKSWDSNMMNMYDENKTESAERYNGVVDGCQALTANICAAGVLDCEAGGFSTNDLRDMIANVLEGAANNV